ncbi:hypothetical protein [Micromonospora sp. NPDC049107]|uniref:hypothetical protein n=1 Tax=unclassified Micromonospora TaxID=2617518 RepID=UPI0033D8F2E2
MDEQLFELATTAGNAVVTLLATDAWQTAKSAMVSLWGVAHPQRVEVISGELDDARAALLAGRRSDGPTVEEELAGEWRGRLRRLLAADPGLADELKRLLDEQLVPAARNAGVATVNQRARAEGNARIYMSGRDLSVNER